MPQAVTEVLDDWDQKSNGVTSNSDDSDPSMRSPVCKAAAFNMIRGAALQVTYRKGRPFVVYPHLRTKWAKGPRRRCHRLTPCSWAIRCEEAAYSCGHRASDEVTFGERPAGAGLQIFLESHSARFAWELDCYNQRPRPVLRRVWRETCVVKSEAGNGF